MYSHSTKPPALSISNFGPKRNNVMRLNELTSLQTGYTQFLSHHHRFYKRAAWLLEADEKGF